MDIESLEHILAQHRFFAGVSEDFRKLVTGCARNVRYEAGQYLFREGEPTDQIFLVRHGRIALQIASPERGPVTFQTIGPDEIVGLAWLVPPYRWTFDGKALELTRAISIDAKCLRDKCEADHDLGYEMMKRFTPVLVERLHSARLQMLDVYGARS
ncbi:MAG TPA: cyclic nucleotide-binding domain-containing protein [Devosiaceae bacterium]